MDKKLLNQKGKIAFITLDLESDWTIGGRGNNNPTFSYIEKYIKMVEELEIPISIFAVGKVIEKNPEIINKLQNRLDCEFYLHSYQHDVTKSYEFTTEIKRGIDAFKSYFDRHPLGYRAPQGNITKSELMKLEELKFKFDSSIYPSYRPGVYNNIRSPITPYYFEFLESLLEMPFTALPKLRIPVSLNYLKLFGKSLKLAIDTIGLPSVVMFDSHLQDFWQTQFHENLPSLRRRLMTRNINRAEDIFTDFIKYIRNKKYEFFKISELIGYNL